MKILTIHSDFLEFEAKKKAFKKAEEGIKEGLQRMEECLVVFTAVEKPDESNVDLIVDKYINEIEKVIEQVKVKNIVLYPYAHLSSNLSKPNIAEEVMKKAEKLLAEKYNVMRSPFGWYKSFTISCKGHPLSELSREFSVEDKNSECVDSSNEVKKIKIDDKFELSNKKLNKDDKAKLSTAFVVGKAVKNLYQNVEIGLIDFYHDSVFVDLAGVKLKESDFDKIKKEVERIIKSKTEFKIGKEIGKFQTEISKDIKNKIYDLDGLGIVSLFEEPFVESTKEIKRFELINLASAYWRNNSNNEQLVRIYCVGFADKEKYKEWKKLREEAEKRDHRKIGQEMDLFSMHKEAPGMPFFHDKGTFIYRKLEEFMLQEMFKLGYEMNKTPMILNKNLWLQSGHWDHYKNNMYFTNIDSTECALKPMNCPSNILVFKNKVHSYKELPIKAGEFGVVHRHELSGVLSGLFRVRCFTQDDAHIFCTKEQLKEQIIELINLVKTIYSAFGFDYSLELSTRPVKAMGDQKIWDMAEKALKEALDSEGLTYIINEGDGAFYGPKIDCHVKDSLGRNWQCGTIQLDFFMPEKFDLTYEGNDSKKHRPIMLHRAIYGSFERFMGVLIEHFAGKFPLWISPNQIKIITVTNKCDKFAKEVEKKFLMNGFRVESDYRNESIGKKVREARNQRFNYIVTIGEKEVEKKNLAVKSRDGEMKFDVNVDDFLKELKVEVDEKEIK